MAVPSRGRSPYTRPAPASRPGEAGTAGEVPLRAARAMRPAQVTVLLPDGKACAGPGPAPGDPGPGSALFRRGLLQVQRARRGQARGRRCSPRAPPRTPPRRRSGPPRSPACGAARPWAAARGRCAGSGPPLRAARSSSRGTGSRPPAGAEGSAWGRRTACGESRVSERWGSALETSNPLGSVGAWARRHQEGCSAHGPARTGSGCPAQGALGSAPGWCALRWCKIRVLRSLRTRSEARGFSVGGVEGAPPVEWAA